MFLVRLYDYKYQYPNIKLLLLNSLKAYPQARGVKTVLLKRNRKPTRPFRHVNAELTHSLQSQPTGYDPDNLIGLKQPFSCTVCRPIE